MQSLSPEQQQCVELLAALYHEIFALEHELQLMVSERDQRPRIDYFYDAVRALLNKDMPVLQRTERLSIEWLAYDATAIRYFENKPLASLSPRTGSAAEKRIIRTNQKELSTSRAGNRDDKALLSKLYLRFGVLFVALFKPFADRDHRDRVEEMDEKAQEIADIKAAMEHLGQGSISPQELLNAAEHAHDAKVSELVKNLIHKQRYKQKESMMAALNMMQEEIRAKDKEIETLQAQHMNFAASQLALFQAGQEVVKQLAQKGLNLAGQHLDQAMSQTNQQTRGR